MPLVYMFHLFEYRLFSLMISDVFLIVLVIYLLIYRKFIHREKLIIKKYYLYLFLFWLLVGLIGIVNFSSAYFSLSSYISSYFKLSLYVLAFILLTDYFIQNYFKLNKIIINSLIILCLLGLYQFIAYYLFPMLPYSLAPELFSIRPGYSAMTSYGIFRIKGVYSEPAHFGIYINMLYAYLIHNNIKLKPMHHIVVITTIILTLSIASIALLLFNFFLISIREKWFYHKPVMNGTALVGIVILILNIDFLSQRIANIFSLTDKSSAIRLLGGFEIARHIPFYGLGIGDQNFINFYHLANITLSYALYDSINNVIVILFSYSGYLGVFLFMLFLLELNKKNIYLGLFLLATFFGWGLFNVTPFWFVLILIATGNNFAQEKNQVCKTDSV